MNPTLKRFAPLVVLLILAAAAFAFGLHRYFTLDTLRDNRQMLQNFVAGSLVLATLTYVAIYIAVVALSLPGGAIMTLTGGFLFGTWLGGALAVVGATVGATVVYLVARLMVGEALRKRAGPFLRRLEDGFRADAFSYLLFLRLVPAFPFWAVNLVPALVGVRLGVFAGATALGIVPATFVFAAFGAGLGDLFDAGRDIQLSDVLSPTLIAAFVGLGLLALLPVAVRFWRARRNKNKPVKE